MKKGTECEALEYGTVPNVLFLGNGINRAFHEDSWGDLIKKISRIKLDDSRLELIKELSSPLQAVAVTKDNVKEGITRYMTEGLNKKTPYKEEKLAAYRGIIEKGYDAILTTNYTYEIEQSMRPDFNCIIKSKSKYRITTQKGSGADEQFGIFKYMDVASENRCPVWHVHGELARPNSMVLGHQNYAKLLSRIYHYLPLFFASYTKSCKQKRSFVPKSWIDYFLIGNIYFVGYGLDSSEMDIWWLISCKKEHIANGSKIYYFDTNLDENNKYGKKLLLNAFDINPISWKVENNHYLDYYKQVGNRMEKLIMFK